MTDDGIRGSAYDEWLAEHRAETERWNRRQARRQKLARWFLIPYGLSALAAGGAIGQVLDAGMVLPAVLLIAGYAGILACQWIQPELLRRGEKP